MSIQGRLLRRKKWYTLEDAARRLSIEFGEEVEIRDVVQLVLDNELPVSIHVDGMPGRKLMVINMEHRPGRPVFADVRTYRTEYHADGTLKTRTGGHRKWVWLAGTYHLRLYDDAIDGWRGWVQGFCAPEFSGVSFALSEPNNPEECYTPLFIDEELEMQPYPEHPSIEEWIITRADLDAFIASLEESEPASGVEVGGIEMRALETFGLLVELYASQHGPDYQHGARPKASRIVKDMLAAIPDDVTNMGDRKLKEHVGAAIKAWEAKKRQ